jgi:hypothetical protein
MLRVSLLLLASVAYADSSPPKPPLLPAACESALTEVGKTLGLGRPELNIDDDDWSIGWGIGPIDCDGDSYYVRVARSRRSASDWTIRKTDDIVTARRRTPGLAVSVEVSMAVYHNRTLARDFVRLSRAAIDRCIYTAAHSASAGSGP